MPLARLDAVGNVEVDKLDREVDGSREAVDDLHGVQRHFHVHQNREIPGRGCGCGSVGVWA